MPPQPIGVAIAGLGFGEKVHLPALAAAPDLKSVALWRPRQERLDAAADVGRMLKAAYGPSKMRLQACEAKVLSKAMHGTLLHGLSATQLIRLEDAVLGGVHRPQH